MINLSFEPVASFSRKKLGATLNSTKNVVNNRTLNNTNKNMNNYLFNNQLQ